MTDDESLTALSEKHGEIAHIVRERQELSDEWETRGGDPVKLPGMLNNGDEYVDTQLIVAIGQLVDRCGEWIGRIRSRNDL